MTEPLFERHFDSPVGHLRLVASSESLIEIHWPGRGRDETPRDGRSPVLDDVVAQLAEYFAGKRTRFDLPLDPRGTVFQQSVWAQLGAIPFGETRSYGDVAKRIGAPKAVRAVGAANGQNPISIVIPCHRVIGANGQLTGFGGGLPVKRWLLDHEARRSGLFAVPTPQAKARAN